MIRCEHCQQGELIKVGEYTSQRGVTWITFKCDHCGAQFSNCVGATNTTTGPPPVALAALPIIPTWRVKVTTYRTLNRWKVRTRSQHSAVDLPRRPS